MMGDGFLSLVYFIRSAVAVIAFGGERHLCGCAVQFVSPLGAIRNHRCKTHVARGLIEYEPNRMRPQVQIGNHRAVGSSVGYGEDSPGSGKALRVRTWVRRLRGSNRPT